MSRWKTWTAALALVALGVVIGATGVMVTHKRDLMGGPEGMPPPPHEMILRTLSDTLDLTAEQYAQARLLTLEVAREFARLRQEDQPRMERLMQGFWAGLDKLLTPDQRDKAKELKERMERHRREMERRMLEGGPPPGPPPGLPPGPPPH